MENINFITKLNELVLEFPDAKIIFSISEDTSFYEHSSLYISESDTNISAEDMAEYEDKLLCREDLRDELAYDLDSLGDYSDLSEDEFDEMIEEKLAYNYDFRKYIIVTVGN